MAVDPGSENYRGGFFDHLDVPALVSMAISAVCFLLLVTMGHPKIQEDAPRERRLDDLSERMARILMPLKTPGSKTESRPAPAPRRPAPPAAGQNALARIERSRQRLSEHLQETGTRVSHAAVLSILSSRNPGGRAGARSPARGGLGNFSDLDQRLSRLDGLTRFESDGGSADGRQRGNGAEKADADPLFRKFAASAVGAAAKIGSFEFERPQLLGGNARQAGGRQLQALSSFINRNQTAIRLLYEERLKSNPGLEGKVTVVLTIEGSGRVSSARIVPEETTLSDTEFHGEILRGVRRWVFPAFQGEPVELKSPFVFKPL